MVPFFITRNFIPEMYNKTQQCDFCSRDQRVQLCILVTTTNTCMFLSNIDKDSEVTDSKISIPVARLCLLRNLVILPHDLDTPT